MSASTPTDSSVTDTISTLVIVTRRSDTGEPEVRIRKSTATGVEMDVFAMSETEPHGLTLKTAIPVDWAFDRSANSLTMWPKKELDRHDQNVMPAVPLNPSEVASEFAATLQNALKSATDEQQVLRRHIVRTISVQDDDLPDLFQPLESGNGQSDGPTRSGMYPNAMWTSVEKFFRLADACGLARNYERGNTDSSQAGSSLGHSRAQQEGTGSNPSIEAEAAASHVVPAAGVLR